MVNFLLQPCIWNQNTTMTQEVSPLSIIKLMATFNHGVCLNFMVEIAILVDKGHGCKIMREGDRRVKVMAYPPVCPERMQLSRLFHCECQSHSFVACVCCVAATFKTCEIKLQPQQNGMFANSAQQHHMVTTDTEIISGILLS